MFMTLNDLCTGSTECREVRQVCPWRGQWLWWRYVIISIKFLFKKTTLTRMCPQISCKSPNFNADERKTRVLPKLRSSSTWIISSIELVLISGKGWGCKTQPLWLCVLKGPRILDLNGDLFQRKGKAARMPVENMEEEGLARIPDLNIAQWIFTCKTNPVCIFWIILNPHTIIHTWPTFPGRQGDAQQADGGDHRAQHGSSLRVRLQG